MLQRSVRLLVEPGPFKMPCVLAIHLALHVKVLACIMPAAYNPGRRPSLSCGYRTWSCEWVCVCVGVQYYDKCILAIQEDPEALSSTWDC